MTIKPIKRAIADFNKAKKHLDKMESDLGKSVGEELKKIGVDLEDMEEKHIHDIQAIIENLPQYSEVTRRLYELILRIQNKN